jgi:hypothetical protein
MYPPNFFGTLPIKSLESAACAWGDPARFLQNLECKGVKGKLFEISTLETEIGRWKQPTAAVLLRVRPTPIHIASMNPVCAFWIEGQGYASQEAKIPAVENSRDLSANEDFSTIIEFEPRLMMLAARQFPCLAHQS